jgi:hypothetical protein
MCTRYNASGIFNYIYIQNLYINIYYDINIVNILTPELNFKVDPFDSHVILNFAM